MSGLRNNDFGLFSSGSGGGGGGGTVTCVAAVGCCGICVTGSPITAAGTLTISGAGISGGVEVLGSGTCSVYRCCVNNLSSGNCSAALGGSFNCASGAWSFAGGGFTNVTSGDCSVIVGGHNNCAIGTHTFVGAGQCNQACAAHSVVAGGLCNCTTAIRSSILGGKFNTGSGCYSTISGGYCNTSSGKYTFIGGGKSNSADAILGLIGGGLCNIVCNSTSSCCAIGSMIAGGIGNNTTGGTFNLPTCAFTVAPTSCNTGAYTFIGGGFQNNTKCNFSTIVAGRFNVTNSNYSVVVGGSCNCVCIGNASSILGGSCNFANDTTGFSSILGGSKNCTCGTTSQVSLVFGQENIACGRWATVLNGFQSCAFGCQSSVLSGGVTNKATGWLSSIVGGAVNISCCINSSILNGNRGCATANFTTILNGGFHCNGVQQGLIGNGSYNYLQNTTSAYCAFGATIVNGVGNNTTGGTFTFAGNSGAGCFTVAPAITNVGCFSFIGNGFQNRTGDNFSSVLNGCCNIVCCCYSTIIGGFCNSNNSVISVIGGGNLHCINGGFNGVFSGTCNCVNGCYSSIGGGTLNLICSNTRNSIISGGDCNTISGAYSFIGGGQLNRNCSNRSVIAGGDTNTISLYADYTTILNGSNNRICCDSGVSGLQSNILGGANNTISSGYSSIVNGLDNCIVYSDKGFIGTGSSNCITTTGDATHNFIGNGTCNTISGYAMCANSILNGYFNTISGYNGNDNAGNNAIVGGVSNVISGGKSVIGGGKYNNILCSVIAPISSLCESACNSFIGGGQGNLLGGIVGNTIVGGTMNTIGCVTSYSIYAPPSSNSVYICSVGDITSVFPGGQCISFINGAGEVVSGCVTSSTYSAPYTIITGGWDNGAFVSNCTLNLICTNGLGTGTSFSGFNQLNSNNFIGGGVLNCILSSGSDKQKNAILSGTCNIIDNGINSTIANGFCNLMNGVSQSFIGSGFCNTMSGYYPVYHFIGAGQFNNIDTPLSASILNGCANCIISDYGQIFNGTSNCILSSSTFGTILNGQANCICDGSPFNAILGGSGNCTRCCYGVVLGGSGNCVRADYSAVFGCDVTNNVACSFKSNKLVADNISGSIAGDLCADGSGIICLVTSDLRLKTGVCNLSSDYGLNAVMQMKPITYCWCENLCKGNHRNIGFIAQDMIQILPEVVSQTNSGYYSFDNRQLIPTLVKSIQELNNCIDSIKSCINEKI